MQTTLVGRKAAKGAKVAISPTKVLNIQAGEELRKVNWIRPNRNTMNEFDSWIEEGISIAKIKAIDRLAGSDADDICQRAATRYTSDGLCLRMWEDLSRPLLMFDVDTTALSTLLGHLNGRCWFVPESGGKTKTVYGMNIGDVPALLEACPVTLQFYVLGRDLEWLITSSDHGQYYVLGAAISEDLRRLGEYYP